jgi:hypothetical protein
MRKLKSRLNLLLITGIFCSVSLHSGKAADDEVTTTTAPSAAISTSTAPSSGTTDSSAAVASGSTTALSANAPSGAGVFSQPPVQVLVTVVGGYDDNITTSRKSSGSGFANGQFDVAYDFGSPRLQLALDATAGGTYYYQHLASQNYDIDLHSALTVKYKATPRLTLGSDILISYLTEPSFNYGVGSNYRNGNYFYTLDKFSAAYQWTQRFSTLTRYTITAINYDNAAIGAFEDRIENLFGNEFRFLLVPTTTLVGEYRYGIVSYSTQTSLDSTTHFALAGLDHTFNPRLTATLRGGAEFRSYERGGDRTAPYVESNLGYTVGRRTAVTWTTRYGIEEPDVAGTQSRTTFRTGLQTKFDLTPRISSTAAIYYDHSDYHGFTVGGGIGRPFAQDTIDGSLRLRFAVTHYVGVTAGYSHTNLTSDLSGFEYSRNHYSAGLNVVF